MNNFDFIPAQNFVFGLSESELKIPISQLLNLKKKLDRDKCSSLFWPPQAKKEKSSVVLTPKASAIKLFIAVIIYLLQ
jgi:hypothetical protein